MKKNVLYIIILSAILVLVGWTQIGKALTTQESKAVVSVSNPRVDAPDYLADGNGLCRQAEHGFVSDT